MADWQSMTADERNAWAAEFMGWTKAKDFSGRLAWVHPRHRGDWKRAQPCPDFTTDANAAREVEAEIERRGLGGEYMYHLRHIVYPSTMFAVVPPLGDAQIFPLVRATPADRCHAAYLAVGGGE